MHCVLKWRWRIRWLLDHPELHSQIVSWMETGGDCHPENFLASELAAFYPKMMQIQTCFFVWLMERETRFGLGALEHAQAFRVIYEIGQTRHNGGPMIDDRQTQPLCWQASFVTSGWVAKSYRQRIGVECPHCGTGLAEGGNRALVPNQGVTIEGYMCIPFAAWNRVTAEPELHLEEEEGETSLLKAGLGQVAPGVDSAVGGLVLR